MTQSILPLSTNLPAMNPEVSIDGQSDESARYFYRQSINAAMAGGPEDVQSSLNWCAGIQEQVIKLTGGLAVRESIHRDLDKSGDTAFEFVESDYGDLIEFITDVGVGVTELSERLRAAKHELERGTITGQP